MFIFILLLVFAACVAGSVWAALQVDDIKLIGFSIAAGAILGTVVSILIF